MNIRDEVRNFISKNLEFENVNFSDDVDYFQTNFVNSLFAMRLVNFIEEKFKIEIPSDDLMLENFSTVNKVLNLIQKKQTDNASRI